MKNEQIERNLNALENVIKGASWGKASVEAGISPTYVTKIWNRTRLMMLHPSRLDETAPRTDSNHIYLMRQHKDFWLRRLGKLREELKAKNA